MWITWNFKLTWDYSSKIVFTFYFSPRQAIEVSKRQIKARESMGNPDNVLKLEAAEAKLHELKSNTAILGKEAVSAMAAVEGQQQRLTLQRIIAMVIQIFFFQYEDLSKSSSNMDNWKLELENCFFYYFNFVLLSIH